MELLDRIAQPILAHSQEVNDILSVSCWQEGRMHLETHVLQQIDRLHLCVSHTHRISPFSFPKPTWSPPTQNRCNALGRSNPSMRLSWPGANRTTFSKRATSSRGIAAAVPLRVCAKGKGAFSVSADDGR